MATLKSAFLFSLLALFFNSSQAQQIRHDPATHRFSLDKEPPLRPQPAARKPPSWGIWFWEFGDGNYSFERSPVHPFAKPGTYQVSLHLTPFYAVNKPWKVQLTKTFSSANSGAAYQYDLEKKWVHIETNATKYVVPDHDMQVAVHYQAPAAGGGYLLFCFNNPEVKAGKETVKLSFDAFEAVPANVRRYFEEQWVAGNAATALRQTSIPSDARTAAENLVNNHDDVFLFLIPAMKQGETRVLFLTLHTSKKLGEKLEKQLDLTFTAFWLPEKGKFDPKKNRADHTMRLLPVHDPNRISVFPRVAYYRKGHPKELFYQVDFQNEAKGTVKDLKVSVPIPSEIDPSTFKIKSVIPEMEPCKGAPHPDSVCYFWAISDHRDSFIITFFNIGLDGKKNYKFFENKKATKGSITFSVKTQDGRTAKTKTRAGITFGGAPTEKTSNATVRWRQKSLYLKPGWNFGLNKSPIPDTFLTDGGFAKHFSLALGYQDAPVGNGFTWGLELSYARQQFQRDTFMELPESPDLPNGGLLFQTEAFNISYLEAKGLLGYQVGGLGRMGVGAGISVPAFAKIDATARLSDFDNGVLAVGNARQNYGLLNSKEDAFLLNQPLSSKPFPGAFWQTNLELGLMNEAVLGLRHELRFFPDFYLGKCETFSNWNIYLRLKIAPIGGKHE